MFLLDPDHAGGLTDAPPAYDDAGGLLGPERYDDRDDEAPGMDWADWLVWLVVLAVLAVVVVARRMKH